MPQTAWRQLYELNQPLHAEIRKRRSFTTSVPLIDAGRMSRRAHDQIQNWAPAGQDHFTLFLAQKGSGYIGQVRAALDDETKASALSDEMKGRYKGQKESYIEEAIGQIIKEPVFAEFRYGDLRLADNLFVPDSIGLAALVFPYEGGRLSGEGFKLVQYGKKGADVALEGLVVHRQPPASDAEKAASGDELVIHPERWCETTGYVAATYAAGAAAAAWAAALAGPTPGAFDIADLGDDVIRALDDSPSVEELAQLRLDVLGDS